MYIHKHRRGLIDAPRIHKLFHLKELALRYVFGWPIGAVCAHYLFGSKTYDAPVTEGFIFRGNTKVEDDDGFIDESNTSLDYSAQIRKEDRTRRLFIPGKIRD